MLIDNIHIVKSIEKLSSQLTPGSDQKIEYICDDCGNKKSTAYHNYRRTRIKNNNRDICNKCAITKAHIKYRLKQEDIIKRLYEINGDKYTYENLFYVNNNTKVLVTCKKHGDFLASPENLLYNKSGCPICKESKGEIMIAKYLDEHNINYLREYTFKNLKNVLPLRVDFYLEDRNLVIEFDGEQHYNYKPDYHKTFCGFIKTRNRDIIKNKYCEDNNIKLLRLRDIKNPEKIKEELNKILCQ